MRYIYNQEGDVVFVQLSHYIYDGKGQFLKNMRIEDGVVYSGTEYDGYIIQNTYYPSEDLKKRDKKN